MKQKVQMQLVLVTHQSRHRNQTSYNRELSEFTGSPGLKFTLDEPFQELGHLKPFLADDLINITVMEMNRYAKQCVVIHVVQPRSGVHEWESNDNSEMHTFLDILYLLAIIIIHKPETGYQPLYDRVAETKSHYEHFHYHTKI